MDEKSPIGMGVPLVFTAEPYRTYGGDSKVYAGDKNGKGKTEIKYAEKPIILPEGYPFIIISLIVAALLWYFGMLYTAVIPFVFPVTFVISSVAPEEMRSSRRGRYDRFPG